MMKKMIILIAAALLVFAAVAGNAVYRATRIPANNAEAFIAAKHDASKKTVVVLGDSITHGAVSYDYVGELAGDRELGNYIFINEGVNSQLAWQLLEKIDRPVRVKPDYIFILIGSNDCIASLNDEEYRRYNETWNLPVRPTKAWFEQNLESLVENLKSRTQARITLISIPPVGEKADSVPFQRSLEYARSVKDIARKTNVGYIGFNELLADEIIKHGSKNIEGFNSNRYAMFSAIGMHYVLMQSWDDISKRRGLQFMPDNLHLNSRGGHILAGKIKEALLSK